jgi:hypothetical protein
MNNLGTGLLVAGVALELIDRFSGPYVSTNPDLAQYQAQIVNLNRTLGDIHISYLLIAVGAYLKWVR